MKKAPVTPSNPEPLTCPAPEPLKGKPLKTFEGLKQLFQEYRARQFELERQNQELQRAEGEDQERRALLAKYHDLYDFAPVGYFNLDREGSILTVNLSGARFLGSERPALVNQRLAAFVSEETRPDFLRFLGRVCAGPSQESCEVTFVKGGVPPVYALVTGSASESGTECRAIIVDISKRREADAELKNRSLRLIAAETKLRQTIASDLHDDIGQVLTVLGMDLHRIAAKLPEGTGADLQSALADSLALIKEIISSVRDLTAELHPLLLEEFGLPDTLSSHLKQFKAQTGLDAAIQSDPGFR